MFADDGNILSSSRDMKELFSIMNGDIKQLCEWFKANKLALNVTKTDYMFLSKGNPKPNGTLNVKIGDFILNRT